MSERFYITTPIYYPNGEPHLGHAYTTICADVIARYHRLNGEETYFLTGTDEHGVKMVKTAAEKGIEPRQLADQNVAVFESLWKEIGITNDDFIRTTSDRHRKGVQSIVQQMVDKGDIYLGGYEGWYDEGQEEFVTETEAKAHDFKSVISGRPLVRYSEPTYFFKLSKYVPAVLEHIERHPTFIQPESRRNEVLSKLKQGVDDLSISRATLKWGIPMPNDPGHVLYVWIDALSNYITALGFGVGDDTLYRKYWPGVHLIGKEILWFHTVYWPAMLMSIGQPLPKQVFAHGWWTADGRKMSKMLGNFVDLDKLRAVVARYGLDSLRFYLLRAAPFGNDLDWSEKEFVTSYNELGNVVGNCLNRVLNMTNKNLGGVVPADPGAPTGDDAAHATFIQKYNNFANDLAEKYRNVALQECVLLPVELARLTNGYIDARAPFKLAKDPAKADELKAVLWRTVQAIYRVAVGLLPVLPEKATAALKQLGVDPAGKPLSQLLSTPLTEGHRIGQGTPLFPKVE